MAGIAFELRNRIARHVRIVVLAGILDQVAFVMVITMTNMQLGRVDNGLNFGRRIVARIIRRAPVRCFSDNAL